MSSATENVTDPEWERMVEKVEAIEATVNRWHGSGLLIKWLLGMLIVSVLGTGGFIVNSINDHNTALALIESRLTDLPPQYLLDRVDANCQSTKDLELRVRALERLSHLKP